MATKTRQGKKALATPQFFRTKPISLKSLTNLFSPTLLSAKRGLRESNKEQAMRTSKTISGK